MLLSRFAPISRAPKKPLLCFIAPLMLRHEIRARVNMGKKRMVAKTN